MSRHRAEAPRRVRARYGRIVAATLALLVTAVALLGGIGLIPIQTGADTTRNTAAGLTQGAGAAGTTTGEHSTQKTTQKTTQRTTTTKSTQQSSRTTQASSTALPAGTGSGRRVVFSEAAQRVWLVGPNNGVLATYPVSGSLTDNLHPGHYAVYSRSRWAVGVQDSGVMQYFVRFTRGQNAPIGFHSIPTKNGHPLQTIAQLGTPQSHGCIRQKLADAKRMWDFAPVGTRVVVI